MSFKVKRGLAAGPLHKISKRCRPTTSRWSNHSKRPATCHDAIDVLVKKRILTESRASAGLARCNPANQLDAFSPSSTPTPSRRPLPFPRLALPQPHSYDSDLRSQKCRPDRKQRRRLRRVRLVFALKRAGNDPSHGLPSAD